MEGAEGAQRIDVTVERTEAAAGNLRTDQRQRLLHFGGRQHFRVVVGRASLIVHAFDELCALAEFVLAEGEMETAILLKRDIEAGLLLQLCGKSAPRL